MDVVFFLLPMAVILALVGLIGFFWAVRSGQFDDLDTPSRRILFEDAKMSSKKEIKSPEN